MGVEPTRFHCHPVGPDTFRPVLQRRDNTIEESLGEGALDQDKDVPH